MRYDGAHTVMPSKASTVAEYLEELPEDRRAAIAKLRTVLKKSLPKGLKEEMQYGMISYVVPHSLYPDGYHCDPSQPLTFASLASQKSHMALYLMTPYMMPHIDAWLREAFAKAGKKLDMGKSCLRFKNLDALPLDVVAELAGKVSVADYIVAYEDGRKASRAAERSKSNRP